MVGEIGVGTTHSAISVLNAIPTGIGGALGIDLRLRARIKLVSEPFVSGSSRVRGYYEVLNDSVLKAVLKVLRESVGYEGGLVAEVESEIPVGVGLKSSSALTNALIKACLNALGIEVSTTELAIMGVKASLVAGITITGAFDDSLATLGEGVYITDNKFLKILKHYVVNEELYAVLLVPNRRNPIQSVKPKVFTRLRKLYELAIKEALEGNWCLAASLNGLLTATVVGTELVPIINILDSDYVVAAGVTGKGPALFALTNDPKYVINEWSDLEGELLVTKVLGGG